ncbi:MAG: DUF3299 domain-containing protein [Chryseosolibacter sp.]
MKATALLIVMLCSSLLYAQKSTYQGFPSLVWPKLYDITFVKGQDNLGQYDKPVFTDAVKALRNKTVILPGYMVPLENTTSSARIMLSSLPLNACFFCGVGGPETVVEVNLKKKTPWMERPIEVKGTLRLNDLDPDQMIYVLEAAEIVGTLDF